MNNASIENPVHKMVDMLALQLEKEKFVPPAAGKVPHQFDLTPGDVANMCGVPYEKQRLIVDAFLQQAPVRLDVNGKIFAPDCVEIVKAATFYRKQLS